MHNSSPQSWKSLSVGTKTAFLILSIFGIIGFFFVAVFVGMQLDLFHVAGASTYRDDNLQITKSIETISTHPVLACRISALNTRAPDTARAISEVLQKPNGPAIATKMLDYSTKQYVFDTEFMSLISECATSPHAQYSAHAQPRTAYGWANSQEWRTLTTALSRDQAIINQAAADAGINPRYIVAGVIGEQFRFFTGMRTAFKSYFEPLKIFGRLSKFSFGIAGLKPDTVRRIERNLKDKSSNFYLGQEYEKFAHYSVAESDASDDPQLARITDPDNNYYSYLYVGLYMRQVSQQWEHQGFPITKNAGVLATLYNLGFNRSLPKPDPMPGGAIITVDGREYTFGQIGDEFYWSGELANEFPY